MSLERLYLELLLGAVVLLCAIAAIRMSHRAGLPSLLAYLGLGLLLGESGLGIGFENAELAHALGFAALALILAEGGLTTNWRVVRSTVPLGATLATLGVGVSIAITATAAHYLLGLDWRLAVLVAAALSATDAAAVFSVLRRLPLPPRIGGTLETESGFNDAPVVILIVLLSTGGSSTSPLGLAVLMIYELAVGAAIGVAVSWVGAYALRRAALPASGLYPVTVMGLAMGAYAAASLAHASGFLAVYLAGVVLGNARLPHGPATRSFAEGVAWLAQIGLFVMLGLLASPSELPREVLPSLVLGFALLLLARPASVFLSVLSVRLAQATGTRTARTYAAGKTVAGIPGAETHALGWREQALLSWAGLRGAVPIVFATVPVGVGLPGARRLFALVFVIVVAFTLLQGPTLPWVARRLGIAASAEAIDVEVESAPLEELGAELLQVRIPSESRLHGVEIFELRLPVGAAITLIVRDEPGGSAQTAGERRRYSFVPDSATVLRRGDELLVVATAAVRDATERRLRAVSRRGKLAGWYGERGE